MDLNFLHPEFDYISLRSLCTVHINKYELQAKQLIQMLFFLFKQMQLYKLLRTSLTTIVYYILHAFQIHKNALQNKKTEPVYLQYQHVHTASFSLEKLGAPVHDFQHG